MEWISNFKNQKPSWAEQKLSKSWAKAEQKLSKSWAKAEQEVLGWGEVVDKFIKNWTCQIKAWKSITIRKSDHCVNYYYYLDHRSNLILYSGGLCWWWKQSWRWEVWRCFVKDSVDDDARNKWILPWPRAKNQLIMRRRQSSNCCFFCCCWSPNGW